MVQSLYNYNDNIVWYWFFFRYNGP